MATVLSDEPNHDGHYFIHIMIHLGYYHSSKLEETSKQIRDLLPRNWEFAIQPDRHYSSLWFRSSDSNMSVITKLTLDGYSIAQASKLDVLDIFWWKNETEVAVSE